MMERVKLYWMQSILEVKLFLIVQVTFSYSFIGEESDLSCQKNEKVILAIQSHFQSVLRRDISHLCLYPMRFYSFTFLFEEAFSE